LASLKANRRTFQRLYLNIGEKGLETKSNEKIDEIVKIANHFGVKTKYLTKGKLGDLTGSRPHQNVVLKASRLEYLNIKKISDIVDLQDETSKDSESGKFYLFLDGVTDPQNFGSILRSAMFFGIDGVIVNKKNACGLTSAVSKVSSGALEFLPIYSVKFVKNFMEEAEKAPNNFKIISTNISEEESDLNDLPFDENRNSED